MGKIRVNVDNLNQNARKLESINREISSLMDELSRVENAAPSYKNQFRSQIQNLTQHARHRLGQRVNQVESMAGRLNRVASDFNAADTMRLSMLSSYSQTGLSGLIPISGRLSEAYQRLLGYGSLMSGGVKGWKIPKLQGKWITAIKDFFRPKTYEERITAGEKKIQKELEAFRLTEEGREMLEEAKKAGILFVIYDKAGNEKTSFGDEKSHKKIVPISLYDFRLYGAGMDHYGGLYSPSERSIYINENSLLTILYVGGTVIHEMQHAINHQRSVGDAFYLPDAPVNQKEEAKVADMPLSDIERELAASVKSWLEDEVIAYDLQYDVSKNITVRSSAKILDRSDGVFTKEEYEFVLVTQDYQRYYEEFINENLKKFFPNGPDYASDVWITEDGEVGVTITERKPVDSTSNNQVYSW